MTYNVFGGTLNLAQSINLLARTFDHACSLKTTGHILMQFYMEMYLGSISQIKVAIFDLD